MLSNWDKSFELMLQSEGGFTDDPRDPGNHMHDGRPGCTNLGVTMMTWELYVQRAATIEEIKGLTPEDVKPLYKTMFWDKVWGDKMPIGLGYLLFDMAVNSGPGRSIMLLQRAVGTTPDGGMGPVTYAATVTHDPVDLIEKFSEAKVEFYESLSTFPTFGKGWLNRVAHVEKQALEMVKQSGQES